MNTQTVLTKHKKFGTDVKTSRNVSRFGGQACLHRRRSDFAPKLQSPMRPEEVIMASQQLQMIFQPLRSPSVTEGPTPEVG